MELALRVPHQCHIHHCRADVRPPASVSKQSLTCRNAAHSSVAHNAMCCPPCHSADGIQCSAKHYIVRSFAMPCRPISNSNIKTLKLAMAACLTAGRQPADPRAMVVLSTSYIVLQDTEANQLLVRLTCNHPCLGCKMPHQLAML